MHPHLAGDVRENLVAVLEFDTEHGVRERFHHRSLYRIVSSLGLAIAATYLTSGAPRKARNCTGSRPARVLDISEFQQSDDSDRPVTWRAVRIPGRATPHPTTSSRLRTRRRGRQKVANGTPALQIVTNYRGKNNVERRRQLRRFRTMCPPYETRLGEPTFAEGERRKGRPYEGQRRALHIGSLARN